MPNRETLLALAAKIEAAEAGSRELDWEIFCQHQPARLPFYEKEMAKTEREAKINGTWAVRSKTIIEWQRGLFAPRYTYSLDAAMQLVPEGLDWELQSSDDNLGLKALARICTGYDWQEVTAATPAQALAAAVLRAAAEGEE